MAERRYERPPSWCVGVWPLLRHRLPFQVRASYDVMECLVRVTGALPWPHQPRTPRLSAGFTRDLDKPLPCAPLFVLNPFMPCFLDSCNKLRYRKVAATTAFNILNFQTSKTEASTADYYVEHISIHYHISQCSGIVCIVLILSVAQNIYIINISIQTKNVVNNKSDVSKSELMYYVQNGKNRLLAPWTGTCVSPFPETHPPLLFCTVKEVPHNLVTVVQNF